MKHLLLLTTLTVLISASTQAQTNAEQAVKNVLTQMRDAFMKNDAAALDKIYADSYVFADPAGAFHNKKDMVGYVKDNKPFKFESVVPSDEKVTVYENTAVLTEHTTEKGFVDKEDIAGEYRWMFIFHKEGNDWKIVAMQGTKAVKQN